MNNVIDCSSVYIFDIENVLTDNTRHIDATFKEFLLEFCRTHDVYVVTEKSWLGTSYQLGSKLIKVIGDVFCNKYDKLFILDLIDANSTVFYFGKNYPLARQICDTNRGQCIMVDTWEETFRLLNRID